MNTSQQPTYSRFSYNHQTLVNDCKVDEECIHVNDYYCQRYLRRVKDNKKTAKVRAFWFSAFLLSLLKAYPIESIYGVGATMSFAAWGFDNAFFL